MVVKLILISIWNKISKITLFGYIGNIAMDMGVLGLWFE